MARTFEVRATVDSASVTDQITGRTTVTAEENQSTTASLSLLPASGTYDPEDWIGVDVTIDYVADPDGTPDVERIFTGSSNLPSLNDTTGVLTLSCSDLIQEDFEALADDAAILAEIPGAKLADEVFGEREDGWQRAQDALSTVRSEAHKSRTGVLTITDWAAKATPDFSYTSSGYVDESPKISYAERRELVNSIGLRYEHRFNRHKIRSHTWSWTAGPDGGTAGWGGFCNWYANSHDLPTTEMIEAAAAGAGWPINGSVSYSHLPEAGVYSCGGGSVGWGGIKDEHATLYDPAAQEELRKSIAISAVWTGRKRFAQTISETYTVTVASAGSIALFGTIPGEDGASLQAESDDSGWESLPDTAIPAGFSADAIGDQVRDENDRTASDNAVVCLMQHADHRIAASHRRNYVEWQTPMEPTISLADTAQITAGRVTAKGKVFQVGHQMTGAAAGNTASAITTIRIACSRGGGGTSDALSAPTPPNTDPTHGAPSSSTNLTNYVGGNDTVDDWDGNDHDGESYVAGNQSIIVTVNPLKIYPRRVQVVSPDIETEARDSVDATASPSYDIAIPDDVFTVTIP